MKIWRPIFSAMIIIGLLGCKTTAGTNSSSIVLAEGESVSLDEGRGIGAIEGESAARLYAAMEWFERETQDPFFGRTHKERAFVSNDTRCQLTCSEESNGPACVALILANSVSGEIKEFDTATSFANNVWTCVIKDQESASAIYHNFLSEAEGPNGSHAQKKFVSDHVILLAQKTTLAGRSQYVVTMRISQ